MIVVLALGEVMAAEHVQTLDLTNFTGRVFFLADLYAHYSALSHLLTSITSEHEDVVVLSTGNLFDYGPEPLDLLRAIESNFFAGRSIHFYSAAGAGEVMLMKLIPENADRRKFYPSTFETNRWNCHGGLWHKDVNRFYLEDLISKLMTTQLPLLLRADFPGSISVGLCSSDYCAIRNSFTDTYNALKSFNKLNINSYRGQFLFGIDHALTPQIIEGVNFMVLGRHPVNSIRKVHGKPLSNQPLLVGNSLHINTGSLDFFSSSRLSFQAPGITLETNPALTLVELRTSAEHKLLLHQLTKKDSGILNIKSSAFDLYSPDNHVMDLL